MSDDEMFRWVLVSAFAIVLPIGFYHRFRAATDEWLDRKQEGLTLLLSIRLLALAGMPGLFAYMIEPGWMGWSSVPLPGWLRWVGVGLGVLAAALLTWTFHSLGRNITDTVVTRKEHFLVTFGPYRHVRHPFYIAFAMATLANALVAANWYVLTLAGLCTTDNPYQERGRESDQAFRR